VKSTPKPGAKTGAASQAGGKNRVCPGHAMSLTDTKCRTAKPRRNPLTDGNGLYLEVKPNGALVGQGQQTARSGRSPNAETEARSEYRAPTKSGRFTVPEVCDLRFVAHDECPATVTKAYVFAGKCDALQDRPLIQTIGLPNQIAGSLLQGDTVSENYIKVEFTVAAKRVGALGSVLEADLANMSDEEVIQRYAVLGEGIERLLREKNEDGTRTWVTDGLCISEQLAPESHEVEGGRAFIEYMCDDESSRAFVEMFRALCKAAGFKKIKITGQSEHGDKYGDVPLRKSSTDPDKTKPPADALLPRYRVACEAMKGGKAFLKKCMELGIATEMDEDCCWIDPVVDQAETVRIGPKVPLEVVIPVLRIIRKHLRSMKYVEPQDWEPAARQIVVGCINREGNRIALSDELLAKIEQLEDSTQLKELITVTQ
jgi:hypothetical protein